METKLLKPGTKILLAYNRAGGTIPPDRVVVITLVTANEFYYDILLLKSPDGRWVDKFVAKSIGMKFREGRAITHHDFTFNMNERSRTLP